MGIRARHVLLGLLTLAAAVAGASVGFSASAAALPSTHGGGGAVPVQTIAAGGSVVSISADGGRVATDVVVKKGSRICNEALVWQPSGNRITHIGEPICQTAASVQSGPADTNFGSLTIAADRVAWVNYSYGNHAYCEGPYTATLANPKPVDLNDGNCDGETGDIYYDFAGSGPLLVTREYTQCAANCAPDYSGTYQDEITLYQVGDKLTKIGPLKRNTHLLDVDASRLLLARGNTLEIVTPNQGKSALFITLPGTFNAAFLSGNDALVVAGTTVAAYDATTGKPGPHRQLPAGSKVADFEHGIVLYTRHGPGVHDGNIDLFRLADGRIRALGTVPGLLAAKLDSSGLFYAYNDPKGGSFAPGHVAFVRFSALTRLLGPSTP